MIRFYSKFFAAAVFFSLFLSLFDQLPLQAENSRGSELWVYEGSQSFSGWHFEGLKPDGNNLRLDPPSLQAGTDPYGSGGYKGGNYYNGAGYFYGEATAPYHAPPGGFDNAVLSWNADTPNGTWVVLKLRALLGNRWTRDYTMGIWASENGTIKRHSAGSQTDADGKVTTDTLVLNSRASAYQLRVFLFTTNREVSPTLKLASVSVARDGQTPSINSPHLWNRELKVPERSQMIYPAGGEVWCSPTSVSMDLAFWGQQTGKGDLVQTVPSAAAHTYDATYKGNGNWPFNTAYAASFGLTAYVSRFLSLSQVEPWIESGIPVIASVAYHPGELNGTPISLTDGHLLVIRGFDIEGNVIVNDPAADPRQGEKIRITYNRTQFERVWQNGSGGMVYLIYPKGHAVPDQSLALGAWLSTKGPEFADPALASIWQNSDAAVSGGGSSKTWTWGPNPISAARLEQYADAPEGYRLVQYFDKSRMEVTHPDGDRNSKWFVTNGLLTVELVSGRIQNGDNSFQDVGAANISVAGDQDSPLAPTYASFANIASLPATGHERRSQELKNAIVTASLDRNGQENNLKPPSPVKTAYYDNALGHNIPDVFWNWINDPVNNIDWVFALGHPISEPYWVTVNLKGQPAQVLVQLYERRVLTFNPINEPQWRVEMGNIGQHYFRWRYPS